MRKPGTETPLRSVPPVDQSSQRLEAVTREFIAKVRHTCAEELTRDPKALRAAVLRLVRRELPLRRGRLRIPVDVGR
jgi:uncharacterized protein (DUF2267 family)